MSSFNGEDGSLEAIGQLDLTDLVELGLRLSCLGGHSDGGG